MTSFTVYNCKGLFISEESALCFSVKYRRRGRCARRTLFRQEEEEHEEKSGKKLRSESH